jgi:hypothetical protein
MRAVSGRTAAILAGIVLVGGGGGWLLAHERDDGGTPNRSATPSGEPTESLSLQVRSCDQLADTVTASFVLQDDDSAVGEHLFPRVTVRNDSEYDVLVALRGQAAAEGAGSSSEIAWPADDSPLVVAAGATRSRTLGGRGADTLDVVDGAEVVSVSVSGTVEGAGGVPSNCPLDVRRASTAVVPVCLDAAPPASRPYPGVPLSKTSGTDLEADVKALQQKLNTLGGECTVIDGIFGNETTRIVRQFQRTSGLPVTGTVNEETWNALFATS